MNTAGKLFFIFCLLLFAFGVVGAQEESGDALLWKMALLKKSGSAYESVPFRQNLTMTRRDAYRLYLDFDSTGYCYVVQEDDEGKLPLVYKKTVSPGDRITLPGDLQGSGEDPDFRAGDLLGTSRLYVIVSVQPRQNLERLMEQHGKDPAAASLERSILSEVLAVRRSLSSLPGPEETSVPLTGEAAIRGELRFFEGRDACVLTVTVRVQ